MINTHSAGSAHRGLGEWMLQRLTAVYISGFVIFIFLHWIVTPASGYQAWRRWVSSIPVRVSATLFFVGVIVHAWIGLRSVYMDYLHALWLRIAAVILTAVMLAAVLVWALGVLWGSAG